MKASTPAKQPIALLKTAVLTLFEKPAVLFPFGLIAFIQLLTLEILFFSTRTPLSGFFGPIIRRLKGELYLHYPFNLMVTTEWFQNSYLQGLIYVVFSSLCIGAAVGVLKAIDNDRPIRIGAFFRDALRSYVHLFIASAITVLAMFGLSDIYGLVINRALKIGATSGIKFFIKQGVLITAPLVNLLLAILVTALFIYVIPIIIIDRKKIFPALFRNFKILARSARFTLTIILLPALLYVPLLLLRSTAPLLQRHFAPEVMLVIAVTGILVSAFIDAVHYTAASMFYLLTKEEL